MLMLEAMRSQFLQASLRQKQFSANASRDNALVAKRVRRLVSGVSSRALGHPHVCATKFRFSGATNKIGAL